MKNKPQDLNYSVLIFSVLLGTLFILISHAANQITPESLQELPVHMQKIGSIATIGVIIHESIFLGILYLLLKRDNKANRFVQVGTNFVGVNLMECMLSILVGRFALGFYLLCALKAWLLVIKFHITSHAFNVTHARASWIFITISISSILAAAMVVAAFSTTV